MTLESGRVKPDDVTTIKLVLDAITQIGHNQYSILINKISSTVEGLLQLPEAREALAACLVPPSLRASTNLIFYVPMNSNLTDQANKWEKLSPNLLSCINNAPNITTTAENIHVIQYPQQFEDILQKLQKEIEELRNDNEALKQAIENRRRTIGELTWTYNPAFATPEDSKE